jgi:anti-sigma regulatory factor (Ser/Thr protein kinase)
VRDAEFPSYRDPDSWKQVDRPRWNAVNRLVPNSRSMAASVQVPTSLRDSRTYERFFRLYAEAMAAADRDDEIELDFADCIFLHQHAVAFLGGLIRTLQDRGCKIGARFGSINPAVHENLKKNGFMRAMGLQAAAGGHNTIPFREDMVRDDGSYLTYLREAWLGRGWVNVSDGLADAIANAVWETYTNAFEHGHSNVGVFSCGQFYPVNKEIAIAFVDFGIGIPGSVRTVPQAAGLADVDAIAWALARGNTSKPGNRGVGLDILRSFVELNRGYMDVVSHRGHVRISEAGAERLCRNQGFPGTVFNITLKADERRYAFKSEIAAEDIF